MINKLYTERSHAKQVVRHHFHIDGEIVHWIDRSFDGGYLVDYSKKSNESQLERMMSYPE